MPDLSFLGPVVDWGFPAVLILLVLKWLAPRLDRLVDAHLGLVDSLKVSTSAQTAIMERQASIQDQQLGQSRESMAMLKEIHEHTVPQHDREVAA